MKIVALIILGIVAAGGLKPPTFAPIHLANLDAFDALKNVLDQESDTLENVLVQVSWALWRVDYKKVC